MLADEIKAEIQSSYSEFLRNKSLRPRYGQKLMIATVARALSSIEVNDKQLRINEAGIAVVEAGTGTGKTVAYVLASLPMARAFNKTLVISTATITLQNQIIEKDLPDILKHSGLQFSFGLAKGRGRYLCLTKLENAMQAQAGVLATLPLFEDRLTEDQKAQQLMEKMLQQYAVMEWSGDRDEWPESIDDNLWHHLTATHRECSNRRCPQFKNCAYFKARQAIEDVDIVVANHDLVLADLALGGGAVLPAPQDSVYVFDEGHHLADKALGHFSASTDIKGCLQWLDQWRKTMRRIEKELVQAESLRKVYGQAEQYMSEAEARLKDLWLVVVQIASFAELKSGQDDVPIYRFVDGKIPDHIKDLTAALQIIFSSLLAGFERINKALKDGLAGENNEINKEEAERWFSIVGNYHQRCEAHFALFRSFSMDDVEGAVPYARWLEQRFVGNQEDVRLQSSPILASRTLERELWQPAFAAIVTSATLTAANKFDRLRMQSGLPDWATYEKVPSPFRYAEVARFVVPANCPDASHPANHTRAIVELLPELIHRQSGSLVLFSSRRQMNEVVERLPVDMLEICHIQDKASRSELIRRHKERIDEDRPSCLIGLASFAEGVDLPGKYLETVIIAKLPFATPDDPIDAALAEWIEKRGGNPFMQITLPDACLKLVQASGRLIRTEADKGDIYLLDNRVLTKRYGKLLLDSLPPFRLQLN
ncbi:ATP-dependent DNA helicase DinG [Gynuella sunshinyii]|uniref:ATP-dependent DNA helicase DinG n=1 Tax=Gynuella sunshinyii YC6258 TaxID=1445510 RepID=A0A0C5VMA5_9GAMM|nr:ATP-dependent DNA helicase DinG [Gynuella sunshinyii]AJQ95842.1 rad3-related DNA helicase [Gynuella sunshinyii YC6258]